MKMLAIIIQTSCIVFLCGCTTVNCDYSIDKYFEKNSAEKNYYLAHRLTSVKTEIEMDELRQHYTRSLAIARLQQYDELHREKRKEDIMSRLALRNKEASLHYTQLESNIGADTPVYHFRYLTKSNTIQSGYILFKNGKIMYRDIESEGHPAESSSVWPRRDAEGIKWP